MGDGEQVDGRRNERPTGPLDGRAGVPAEGPARAAALGAALTKLLPETVLCAAASIDGRAQLVHAAERALVTRAVAKRQQEFASGRVLAHELIARLGVADGPLLPCGEQGRRRAPRWPDGLLGSISHGAGFCVVAVARSTECSALGLDVEGSAPLTRKLWRHILRDEERSELARLSDEDAGARAKLVFSAKECFYKALSPRLSRVLNFEDVRLEISADGCFRGELLVDDAGLLLEGPLEGAWATVGNVVLSSLAVEGTRSWRW